MSPSTKHQLTIFGIRPGYENSLPWRIRRMNPTHQLIKTAGSKIAAAAIASGGMRNPILRLQPDQGPAERHTISLLPQSSPNPQIPGRHLPRVASLGPTDLMRQ